MLNAYFVVARTFLSARINAFSCQMNRPFGAVDVSANLKNAVPKAATQKILVSLAEKGELTQKLYGAKFIKRICLGTF